MFQLTDVSKVYSGRTVVDGLNLEVPPGKTLALVGPSGCGKSTLFRLMLGLIQPDSGSITLQGRPMSGDAMLQMRHAIGYVVQDGGLFPHLTARQNVCLMANYLGWPRARQAERLDELRRLTHLPVDALDRHPELISGGQQQRVALMRALMLDPDVLLLDEPLGALDPLIRAELQTDLREIFRSLGKTVVIVTHDIGEAAFLGDEMVLLRAGRMIQRGTIDELLEQPSDPFVTQFINAGRSPLDGVFP